MSEGQRGDARGRTDDRARNGDVESTSPEADPLAREDDELTDRLAEQGARRFDELLSRLGE
jgi:hypothetical protein